MENNLESEDLILSVRACLLDKLVYAWEINLLKKPSHQVSNYILEVCGALLLESDDLGIELTGDVIREIFSVIMRKYGRPKNWNNHFPELKHYCDALNYLVEKEGLKNRSNDS